MDRGKVAEECETYSPHAICSLDTAFLFPCVLTDLFKTELRIAALWKHPYAHRERAHTSKKNASLLWFFIRRWCLCFCSCCCICSPGAVQPARQVQETKNCLYEPAVAGVGASVQAEQVPVTTEAVRGGHVTHADRNSGIQEYVLFVFSTCITYILE